MSDLDIGLFTPYSTVTPFIQNDGFPVWVGDEDKARVAAYDKFDEIYWSDPRSFKLLRRGDDELPIYVPNPRKVVDVTSHYYMKGLSVAPAKDSQTEQGKFLDDLLKRERFFSRFITAKHSGVTRGDFLLHITADPNLPPGARISINAVHPGEYFPIYDADDLDKLTGVRLVTQWLEAGDSSVTRVKILEYRYVQVGGRRRIQRQEGIWKMQGWNNPKEAKLLSVTLPKNLLAEEIPRIPLYHYKNLDWQGEPFGSSELRGFERLAQAVNQVVSDLEVALALDGLGVYATDAGRPINEDTGEEEDWEIAPGRVLEVPGATMFKRVEGISSSNPALDFARYLQESLYEASSTSKVALGNVDVQLAESGIGLAIQFMPTVAKLEQRDQSGVEITQNFFFDLMFWVKVFEGLDFVDQELLVTLGEKLPINRRTEVEELNNMLDRNVISRKFYRKRMTRFGYEFPEGIDQEIQNELLEINKTKVSLQLAPADESQGIPGPGGRLQGAGDTLPQNNQSNNQNKPNESRGTELNSAK